MQQLILELAPPPAPTLDNFFPGRNAPTLAALRDALAGRERFVYLWGEPGSGRTHLLRGFVAAAEASGGRGSYAAGPCCDIAPATDAAALDDVERLDIVGQLAAFDLYNALRQGEGSLAAAGDRPPAQLPLREDLRTRIGSGVVLQLHSLTDAEKRRALEAHAAGRGMRVGDDILDYLLTRHARDMGAQVAVIDALDRLSLQAKRAPTLGLLREALRHA